MTGKAYRGINVFLLRAMPYENAFWLTFRQALELGGNVRAGEKGCPVVFWKQNTVEDEETGEEKSIPLLRVYHVFNLCQCEGIRPVPPPADPLATRISKPAEIAGRMPQPPVIKHGMTSAFYSPLRDVVGMPDRHHFDGEEEYFATLFHELVHASGHTMRLNRPTLTEKAGYSSNPYAKEELIAEMGAAFLCGQAGILDQTLENSAAYLNGWLQQLRSDKTLIVQAASQAQKAADFILGTNHAGGQNHE